MKDLGYMLMQFAIGVLKFSGRALVLCGKMTAWLVLPLAAAALRRVTAPRKPRTAKVEVAAVNVTVPDMPEALVQETGPVTIITTGEFEIADRIVSMRLDPPVGVINLRVYNNTGIVKRDLIISEPCLKAMMKGRRHTFPDAPYDPLVGLDAIKDETIELAEKLINDLGSQSVKATKPRKDDFVRAKAPAPPAPAPAKEGPRQEQAKPAPVQQLANQAPPQHRADAPPSRVVAPRVNTGYTYVGRLMKAGSQEVKPQGRQPYEVFEATLELDNGAELALRGAELERELTASGCQVGHRVAITPMGKVPVSLGNGGEGQKNLYRVQNMTAKAKG